MSEIVIESRDEAPDYKREIAALKAKLAKEQAEADAVRKKLAETTAAYRASVAGDKITLEKQQLDKEIAENAGVLGQLRDVHTLDSSLGATGLNADMMNGIGGLIGERGTMMPNLRDPATLDPALGARKDKITLEKQQLDKEIAENAGVLGQLRDTATLDSALGQTGLNTDGLNTDRSKLSREERVKMDIKQLDREIRENADVLGALRDDATLDSALGQTGLNADMMNGIKGLIEPGAIETPKEES